MSDKMVMRIAKFHISDVGRGLNMNRGVYIKAPEDFFAKYGKSTPVPKVPFDEKEHHLMEITNWPEIKAKLEDGIVKSRPNPTIRATNTTPRPTVIKDASASKGQPQSIPGMNTTNAAVPGAPPPPKRMTASELLANKKPEPKVEVTPETETPKVPETPKVEPKAETKPPVAPKPPAAPKAKPKPKAKAKAKPRKAKVS